MFGQLLEEVSSLDSKLFRSFRAFLFSPGLLAYEHWRGARKPYLKPVTLFLIVNVIYFLVSPITDFALPLNNQAIQPYGAWVTKVIDGYVASSGESFDQVAARYDALTQVVAKSIVIVSVPFLVPFVWICSPFRRYYLLDHTVFALHHYAFVLIWPVAASGIGYSLHALGLEAFLPGWANAALLFLPLYAYGVVGVKRAYGGGWIGALLKGIVLFAGVAVSHFIYRLIQFWVVWWQVT
ncbi:DUF3667 domain-containing protein [Kordiimonas lacus]|uniref:DUF3667 domain-containing protein n=1 Tax=Kordiimonas lacus TaxID=637679 RepID=A0A1G6ZUB0_9PROT|nr:DUF3667 domain-containing protein [Kordiimonas lacus]SDE06090.1 Protein of unknown function [Kordiimonas lacus]